MVCKGSWVLGSACGTCQRCSDTMPDAVETIRQLRNEVDDLRGAAEAYRDRLREIVKIAGKI